MHKRINMLETIYEVDENENIMSADDSWKSGDK